MRINMACIGLLVIAFSALSYCVAGEIRGGARDGTHNGAREGTRDGMREKIRAKLLERMREKQGAQEQGQEDGAEKPAAFALPPGARVIRDIAYGDDPLQAMDVYVPQKPAGPVILMVHGGGWWRGDKANSGVVENKVAHWLPQGVILVSVNYRLLPEADPLTQADDVAQALVTAQSKAKDWGGDPARFVLMGHSAGAHLVALLGADPSIVLGNGKKAAIRQKAKPWLGTVALDSAALDVVEIMENPHPSLYDDAFGTDPEYWRKASPTYRIANKGAPMLMVCSEFRADSSAQAKNFAKKVVEKGREAEVLPVALNHGEINTTLGLPSEYTDAVDAFLRKIGIIK